MIERVLSSHPVSVLRALKREGAGGELARGAVASFLVKGSGVALTFVVQVMIARLAGAQVFGEYIYMFSWISLLVLPATLGLDLSSQRFLPTYRIRHEWRPYAGFLRRSVWVTLGVSSALSLGLVVVARHRGPAKVGLPEGLIFAAALALPLFALLKVVGSFLRAEKRMFHGQWPEMVLRPVLFAGGSLTAVWFFGRRVTSTQIMGANGIAFLLALAVSAIMVWRALPMDVRKTEREYHTVSWVVVSLPILLLFGFSVFQYTLPTLLVGPLISTTEAGIYAAASRIATLITFGVQAVNTIAMPMIAEPLLRGTATAIAAAHYAGESLGPSGLPSPDGALRDRGPLDPWPIRGRIQGGLCRAHNGRGGERHRQRGRSCGLATLDDGASQSSSCHRRCQRTRSHCPELDTDPSFWNRRSCAGNCHLLVSNESELRSRGIPQRGDQFDAVWVASRQARYGERAIA